MRCVFAASRRLPPSPFLTLLAVGLTLSSVLPGRAAWGEPSAPWVEVRSAHLRLYTDAGAARGREIVGRLELFRSLFARLAPELELRSPVPTRVIAFGDAAAYAPYKSEADRGRVRILGQYLRGRDGDFLTLLADPREEAAQGVAYHELVHLFVQHNFPSMPLWLNEGLAEYYGTFVVEAGKAIIGRPQLRHLRWLEGDLELALADILSARSVGEVPGDDAQGVGRLYAVSWLLTHYLLSGDEERLARVGTYLGLLAEGEESLDAFEEAFGQRASMLEDELLAYLQLGDFPVAALELAQLPAVAPAEVRPVSRAESEAVQGDLSLALGRFGQAAQSYHRALEREPLRAAALSGLAVVKDRSESFDEARPLHREALAQSPRDALPYVRYGRHLLARLAASRGRPEPEVKALAEEARTVLSRSVELAPSFAEAAALLGRAHLFAGGDPTEGARSLERALRALPLRMDVAFDLVQLRVKAGEMELAKELVETVIQRYGELEMVLAAEELVERGRLLLAADRAFREGRRHDGLELFDLAVSVTSDPDLRLEMETELRRLQETSSRGGSPP